MIKICMGIGAIAGLGVVTTLAVTWGFIKILTILGVVVALALLFIAGGLLWGCIELGRM